MEITFFSLILIVLFVIFILRNNKFSIIFKKLFFYSIIALLVLDIGYFAKIGSFTIEYNYVFSIITFIFAIVCLYKYKIKLKNFKTLAIFIIYLLVGILIPLIFRIHYKSVSPNDAWELYIGTNDGLPNAYIGFHSFFIVLRTFIFFFNLTIFVQLSNKRDIFYYMKTTYKISIVLLIMMILELFLGNIMINIVFRQRLLDIFGHSDATYLVSRQSFGIYVPMLLMREPSSFSYSTMIVLLNNIVLYHYTRNKKKRIEILVISICISLFLVLSMSLSAYIYILALVLILIYLSKDSLKLFGLLVVFGSIIVSILFVSMGDRINTTLEAFNVINKDPSEIEVRSEVIRVYSIWNNIINFFKNPLLGCGTGSIYSYSSLITLFSNIGIIGVLIYIYLISDLTNNFFKVKYLSIISIVFILVSHGITGHMSYLLYLDRIAYVYLLLKLCSILKCGGEKKYAL